MRPELRYRLCNRRAFYTQSPFLNRSGWVWVKVALTSLAEPRQIYPFRNVILNPVAVPPFLRVDLYAIELYGEMDMVASGHSRLPTGAHHLAAKGCRECVLGN